MKTTNLSLLPDHERQDIELQRRAALLIHNMKTGKINRQSIQAEINKLEEQDKDRFKLHLNKYKGMK